jgi:enoyl-CoA hydratase
MIATSRSGAVALLTIDRHERRNALDTEHCLALHEAVTKAADEARVIVITGSGSAFCAGADLSDAYTPAFRSALRALLELLGDVTVPVIAAVNGPALGAGTQLAIAADLRIVAPAARFGIPAGRLGLAVDHWTVRRLAHLVGGGTARLVLLAGEEVDAEEALQRGLAERAGDLDEALRWASGIAELAPLTLRAHKLALERAGGEEPDDSDVVAAVRAAWESADFAEGLAAFGERRRPHFEGR